MMELMPSPTMPKACVAPSDQGFDDDVGGVFVGRKSRSGLRRNQGFRFGKGCRRRSRGVGADRKRARGSQLNKAAAIEIRMTVLHNPVFPISPADL
jgi:hypothetical protein